MTVALPINIDSLLRWRTIESERVEYKAGWNPESVLHTLGAFANDFHNLGGGYVVLGVEERNGRPVLPPKGLDPDAIDGKRNYLKEAVVKHADKPEADRFWNFPVAAIEEALGNAIYHRSYEEREPVEVRITPEELLVLSFPAADRSIRMEDLQQGRAVSRRYRNRRIGEFLKELDLAEGRSTGVPKILRAMRNNGSPAPRFETDDDRTWFLVRLPAHGEFSRSEEWGGAEQHAGQDAVHDNFLKNMERESPTEQDTEQVTEQVGLLVLALTGEMRRLELQDLLRIVHRPHFLETYLNPALKAGLIEMTLPDKPTSRNQRYRRMSAGEALARQLTESSK